MKKCSQSKSELPRLGSLEIYSRMFDGQDRVMRQSVGKGSDPVIRRRTILKYDSRFDNKELYFPALEIWSQRCIMEMHI